jgi:hypothetical protein
MLDDVQLLTRAELYAMRSNTKLLHGDALGRGIDGSVWQTVRPSAVKAFRAVSNYRNELECYRRLHTESVRSLGKFAIPMLLGYSDDLMVIEMSIVRPPYLLDFGKVYLDEVPPHKFDARTLAAEQAQARALFGSQWPEVAAVLRELQTRFGIIYIDPRPHNIDCGVDDPDWDREPMLDYSEYDVE